MRINKYILEILKHLAMIIVCLIVVFPVLWILSQSLKSYFDTIAIPPVVFVKPIIENYIEVIHRGTFLDALMDGLIVALGSTLLGLILGTPCSYALARLKFKGANIFGFFILITRMVSPIVIIIPLNRLFQILGLTDTHLGIILVHSFINLGIVVWMLRGFFADIPVEIEEAARIDGYSHFNVFLKIALPLVTPGLAATSIFCFILSWNELLVAMTMGGDLVRTTPVFIISEFTGYLAIEWGQMSAACMLIALPMIIFVLSIQKHFVKGLAAGAIQ